MFIRLDTAMYLEVADLEEAEQAASLVNSGAANVLNRDFPHGDVIDVEVDGTHKLTTDEVEERGYEEGDDGAGG